MALYEGYYKRFSELPLSTLSIFRPCSQLRQTMIQSSVKVRVNGSVISCTAYTWLLLRTTSKR